MVSRSHPPGYHCSKALRQLGFEAGSISRALRRQLALTTGEIAVVLAYPVTPPDGVPIATPVSEVVDVTDHVEATDGVDAAS